MENFNGKFQGVYQKLGKNVDFQENSRGGGYGKFEDVMENFNGKFQGVYQKLRKFFLEKPNITDK